MRLTRFIFCLVLCPLATGQEPPAPKEPSQAEEAPTAPTVTVSPVGIVVITGATNEEKAPEATEKDADAKAKADESTASEKAPAGSKAEADAEDPPAPTSRRVNQYSYDPAGRPMPTGISISGHTSPTARSTTRRLRNSSGRDVPYLVESEQLLNPTTEGRVIEQRTHRYDTAGNPVSQQLVRDEERLLPDGSVQRIVTVYESDVNGRMQPTERTTTVERKVGNSTRSVTTAERPGLNERFQTYRRDESLRTEKGDGSAKITTTRKVDNGAGRLIESEREESNLTRSGNVATTETKVWKRSVVNQDRFEPASRTLGKLVENSDGSTSETVETYASSSGGGAVNLNAGGAFALQQTTQRETRQGTGGEVTENTTTRSRSIADPSRMGHREVVRSVTRPTADGQRVETRSFEEGFNGRLRPTGTLVEEVREQ